MKAVPNVSPPHAMQTNAPAASETRNKQIFPSGFSSTPSDDTAQPYHFALRQMYAVLTGSCGPHPHGEEIVVNFAWYCTHSTHEFILVEFVDRALGLKNLLVLDRDGDVARKARTSLAGSLLVETPPRPRFRVSSDGNRDTLLEHCDLKSHQVLQTLQFSEDQPFLLAHLATVALVVHPESAKGNLPSDMFVNLVWDSIKRLRPGAGCKELHEQGGRTGFRRLRRPGPKPDLKPAVDRIVESAELQLREVDLMLQKNKAQHDANNVAALQEENERLKKEVAELGLSNSDAQGS